MVYCPFFGRMEFVKDIIGTELGIFEKKFAAAVKGDVPMLDRVMQYIIKRKGKQMRPMFVFLSAKLHGTINESTYRAAAMVEILHTATLVHDDVVDESFERRGFFSINALWKNKIAILVGDYLFAKGLLLSTTHEDFRHLHILSDAIRQMSEGELLQLEKARKLNLNEQVYFDIIRSKTASLLSSACAAGAWSTSQDEGITEKMKLFGEKAGIAFQIKDDLFDYGKANVGKPTGNDIKEKKLTLPLIYTLNKVDAATRRKLIYIIKNENKTADKVAQVIDAVIHNGGIDYATEKMMALRDEALDILAHFPPSDARSALEGLVRYATDRKY
jgi:octaprenyl-diphosphate synthase